MSITVVDWRTKGAVIPRCTLPELVSYRCEPQLAKVGRTPGNGRRVPAAASSRRLEPALPAVRGMDERRIGDLFSRIFVVEEVAVQPLETRPAPRPARFVAPSLVKLIPATAHRGCAATRRWARCCARKRISIFMPSLARMADLAMVCSSGRSCLERGAAAGGRGAGHQQRLGVGIEVVDLLDDELGPACTTFFTVQRSRSEDALAVLLRDVGQFHLDLEDLPVAVLRVDIDVVLRQAWRLPVGMLRVWQYSLTKCAAHSADDARKWAERPRRGAVALVADRLVARITVKSSNLASIEGYREN